MPDLIRYEMMPILVEPVPVPVEAFAALLAEHARFLQTGGAKGIWNSVVTEDDLEIGMVMGIYRKPSGGGEEGAQADLSLKRLEGLDLRGANLAWGNLVGVWAEGQDLRGANLSHCMATDAFLRGADLRRADLSGADFSRADLSGCDLREANLSGADLEQADLSDADLSGAVLDGARFPGARLDGAKGITRP